MNLADVRPRKKEPEPPSSQPLVTSSPVLRGGNPPGTDAVRRRRDDPTAVRGRTVISVHMATPADAGELLTAQLAAYVEEAQAVHRADIPPLRDRLSDVQDAISTGQVLVARDLHDAAPGRLVGEGWPHRGRRLQLSRSAGGRPRPATRRYRRTADDRRGQGGYRDRIDPHRPGHPTKQRPRRRNVRPAGGWRALPAGPGTGRLAVDDAGIELLSMRKELAAYAEEAFKVRRERGSRR